MATSLFTKKDRQLMFKAVWRDTPKEQRHRIGKQRAVESYKEFGGGVVTALTMCDEEIAHRFDLATQPPILLTYRGA